MVTPCSNSVDSSCRKPEECMVYSLFDARARFSFFSETRNKWVKHCHLLCGSNMQPPPSWTYFVYNSLLKSILSFLFSPATCEFSCWPLSFLTSSLHFINFSSYCLLFIPWFSVVLILRSFYYSYLLSHIHQLNQNRF